MLFTNENIFKTKYSMIDKEHVPQGQIDISRQKHHVCLGLYKI